jgi:hypothetical protein
MTSNLSTYSLEIRNHEGRRSFMAAKVPFHRQCLRHCLLASIYLEYKSIAIFTINDNVKLTDMRCEELIDMKSIFSPHSVSPLEA